MFEIGWTEMLVIAVVMIVVVGPKDLPKMLRTFGKTTSKMRAMAGDFQKQFNEALKEAELDDVKKSVDALKGLNPASEIRKQLNPFEKAAADVRAGLDNAAKPKPAATEAQPAEPLKAGATGMPVAGPEKMPEPPLFPAPLFPAMSDPAPAGTAVPAAPAANAPANSVTVAKSAPATPPKAEQKPKAVKTEAAHPKAPKPAKAPPIAAEAAPAAAASPKPKPATARKKPAGSAA